MDTLLEIRDLSVAYPAGPGAWVPALSGISLTLERGASLGIIGETGSGKSTLALTLIGLAASARVRGEILYDHKPLPPRDSEAMRRMRWRRIALAFQGSGNAFNPVRSFEDQLVEPVVEHLGMDRPAARARMRTRWTDAGLAPELITRFPHQLSGGEKQRAMLVMALACDPDLLIVDEPTSGLDLVTRHHILARLAEWRRQRRVTLIAITHELDDLAGLADRTMVLYAGRVLESGPTAKVLDDPRHPYAWGLINAFPRMDRTKDLRGIRGRPPDPLHLPPGCVFHPRCTQAIDNCVSLVPALVPSDGRWVACHRGGLQTLLEIRGLWISLPEAPDIVRNASLAVREGEVVALVGQTGSGKSTLAKGVVGLYEPTAGQVCFEGRDLRALGRRERQIMQRRLQMIFQDPWEALSPRLSVLEIVREPLDIQGIGTRPERDASVRAVLDDVRLPAGPEFLGKHTHELSGGQLERIALARALVLQPKLIIADEPVAMLDASEQARTLVLIKEIQNERGMGLLLISHDLALVRKVADRIAVLQRGTIVEQGLSEQILTHPVHPYTQALVAAAGREQTLTGEYYVDGTETA